MNRHTDIVQDIDIRQIFGHLYQGKTNIIPLYF